MQPLSTVEDPPCCSTSCSDQSSGIPVQVQRTEQLWRKVSMFCAIYGTGWLLALAYLALVAAALKFSWPHDSFNFAVSDRYADLIKSWIQARAPNPYKNYGGGVEGAYFPLAYVLLRQLRNLSSKTVVLIYIVGSFAAVASVWYGWLRGQWSLLETDSRRHMVVMLTFFVIACNYPMAFAIDRGNIDPLGMALIYWAFELARKHKRIASGLMIALAGAPKGFPFAAVLHSIRRRQLLAVVVAAVAMALAVTVPAMAFDGGIRQSLSALSKNIQGFRHIYVLGSGSAHYSSDWLNGFRLVNRWLLGWQFDVSILATVYEYTVLLCAGVLAFLAVFVVRDKWRESLAVILLMLIYPNVTNDYKLILLIVPLLHWFASDARGWRSTIFGVTVALLLVPKHYYFPKPEDAASISCVINPLLIFGLFAALWPTSSELSRLAYGARSLLQRLSLRGQVART